MNYTDAILNELQTNTARGYYYVSHDLIADLYPNIADRLEQFKQDCWNRGMVVENDDDMRGVMVRAMNSNERFITGRLP